MPQPPQYPTLWHSLLFELLHVQGSCHLHTRYRWPEAMCTPVCVRGGAIVPLKFQNARMRWGVVKVKWRKKV